MCQMLQVEFERFALSLLHESLFNLSFIFASKLLRFSQCL